MRTLLTGLVALLLLVACATAPPSGPSPWRQCIEERDRVDRARWTQQTQQWVQAVNAYAAELDRKNAALYSWDIGLGNRREELRQWMRDHPAPESTSIAELWAPCEGLPKSKSADEVYEDPLDTTNTFLGLILLNQLYGPRR